VCATAGLTPDPQSKSQCAPVAFAIGQADMDVPLNGKNDRDGDVRILRRRLSGVHREVDVVKHEVANRYRPEPQLPDRDGLHSRLLAVNCGIFASTVFSIQRNVETKSGA